MGIVTPVFVEYKKGSHGDGVWGRERKRKIKREKVAVCD